MTVLQDASKKKQWGLTRNVEDFWGLPLKIKIYWGFLGASWGLPAIFSLTGHKFCSCRLKKLCLAWKSSQKTFINT